MTIHALALLALLAAPQAPVTPSLPGGRFGKVQLFRPPSEPARVVLYLLDGPQVAREREVAAALAADGALVLGLSTARWAQRGGRERCAYPAGDLEWVSQAAQKRLGLRSYLHPILLGDEGGAIVVHEAVAQAPDGTFLGSIGVGARADAVRRVRFCRAAAPHRGTAPPRGDLSGPDPRRVRDAVAAIDAAARPTGPPAPSAGPAVADLPLVEVPAQGAGNGVFAVLVTGDGGWAGIDREIAAELAASGLPVIGLDSLKYFWTARTPEVLAADLARIVEHYAVALGRPEVALVGYSRGADVLPAATSLLPPATRGRVRLLAILGPGREAEFELHLTDFFLGGSKGRPILPDVQRLAGTPVLCLYGREEADESLCPLLVQGGATRVVELAGSHHFGGDYAAVAREVLRGLQPGR